MQRDSPPHPAPGQPDAPTGRRDVLRAGALSGFGVLGLGTAPALAQASSAGQDPGHILVLTSTTELGRTRPPAQVETIVTLGFDRAGDGGGALWRRRNGEVTDEDRQTADGGHWQLIPEAGVVNVRQFGASGTGRRDDTDAIRRAFAFMRRTGASTLFFPPGTYRVTGRIIAFGPGDKRFAIQGADADTTHILVGADLPESLIEIAGGPGRERAEWISFRELTFVNRNRRFSGDAVSIRFAYHVDWIRCRWIDFDGRALTLDNYWDSNFEGCRVIGCGSPEAEDAQAAGVPYRTGLSAIWIGCTEDCDSSNNLNFNACQFEASWHHQMEIDYFARRIHLNSCKFHGRQGVTIRKSQLMVRGARSGKILGCAFAHALDHDHIAFEDPGQGRLARGWIVTGCDFSYSKGAALRLRAVSHMVVTHNNFGAIGKNAATIVIEDRLTNPDRDGQIIIAPNTYTPGEVPPQVADRAQIAPAETDPVRTASSRWDGGHLQLGNHHLWVDATGRLRIKDGPPDHDEDGRAL
jgi:hypothetical protein